MPDRRAVALLSARPAIMPTVLDASSRPPDPFCPACDEPLAYVETEVSSGAFRTQAASMPQIQIHYYDCPACGTCWKLGQRLLPDPVRQTLRGTGA
jgi:hypothetical protein